MEILITVDNKVLANVVTKEDRFDHYSNAVDLCIATLTRLKAEFALELARQAVSRANETLDGVRDMCIL
jgi:hypothetical protein